MFFSVQTDTCFGSPMVVNAVIRNNKIFKLGIYIWFSDNKIYIRLYIKVYCAYVSIQFLQDHLQ